MTIETSHAAAAKPEPQPSRMRKRGLTVSAPVPGALKKTKIDPPPLPKLLASLSTTLAKDDSQKEPDTTQDNVDSLKPSDVETQKKATTQDATAKGEDKPPREQRLPGDGPHVFFLGGDWLIELLDGEPACHMMRKDHALHVWSRVAGLPEDEGEKVASDLMSSFEFWHPVMEDGAMETDEAKELKRIYEDGLEEEPGEQWWYEVSVQRQKPDEGPAVEIMWDEGRSERLSKDQKGSWWITKIAVPDGEAMKAVEFMSDRSEVECFY